MPHLRAQVSVARLPAPTSPRRQSTPYCVKSYGHWKHSPIRNHDDQLRHKDGRRHRQDRLPDFPSRTTKDLMGETQFEDRRHHSSIPFTDDNKAGWQRRDPTTHLEVVGRDGGGHRLREHPHDVRSLPGKHGHQSHSAQQHQKRKRKRKKNGQPEQAMRRGGGQHVHVDIDWVRSQAKASVQPNPAKLALFAAATSVLGVKRAPRPARASGVHRIY